MLIAGVRVAGGASDWTNVNDSLLDFSSCMSGRAWDFFFFFFFGWGWGGGGFGAVAGDKDSNDEEM